MVDSDAIAREVVAPGQPTLVALVKEFGDVIVASDGSLDRGALATVAFANEDATERLNAIMHPAIRSATASQFFELRHYPVVVHDIPLLVETNVVNDYDLTVVVDTPVNIRLQRLVELRGLSTEDAERRISSQATDEERLAVCDVALDNSGTPEQLVHEFDAMWESYIQPHMLH